MWKLSICLVFLGTAVLAQQQHHCIADDGTELGDMNFHEWQNGEVSEGNFDVRVTSGYRELGATRQFIYCLENLRRSSVHFKWDGPKPDNLLNSKLGRPPKDGRTGKVKAHRDTTGMPDDVAVRGLNLRLSESEDYEPFEVETYFEKAEAPLVESVPVQGEPVVTVSSGAEFAAALAGLGGPLELSAGVVLDLPQDPESWTEFVEGGGEGVVESSRVMAEVVLRYDRDSLEVTVEAVFGFSPAFPEPTPDKFFSIVSLDLGEGFKSFGFEGVATLQPSVQGGLQDVRPGFVGFTQTTPIGSLAAFAQDARALSRDNLPVRLLIDGDPVAEFGLEVIGAPPNL